MPKALRKKQNLYALWFPASSVIHAGPALSGPPKLCIFSSSRFSSVLKDTSAGALPYLPVIIRTEQEILVSQCDGFYFGKESPTYHVELKNKYPTKALLLLLNRTLNALLAAPFAS